MHSDHPCSRLINRAHFTAPFLCSSALVALFCSVAAAVPPTLTWDAGGTHPTSPVGGSGNWDTTTSANWSNSSSDSTWVNGDTAAFGVPPDGTNSTVTIDDPSGTVTAAGLSFANNFSSNPGSFTIAAIPGDSLTLTNPSINTLYASATISAPIISPSGLQIASGGGLVLSGQSAYTGPTTLAPGLTINYVTRTTGLILTDGASLGNTAISGTSNDFLRATGNVTIGTTGPGTQGASIDVSDCDLTSPATTLTINDENSYTGNALTVTGNVGLTFYIGLQHNNSEIIINGGGTINAAALEQSLIVSLPYIPGPTNPLSAGDYTIISDPAGNLVPGSLDNVLYYTTPYFLYTGTITNTASAVIFDLSDPTPNITPEPTTFAGLATLSILSLARRRKT